MSITSSKISFGTQFKAHIGANHAARHLRLKKLGNKQKKEKVVQSVLTKGKQIQIGYVDRISRETLEKRLEKTPSNARCFAQGSSLMC